MLTCRVAFTALLAYSWSSAALAQTTASPIIPAERADQNAPARSHTNGPRNQRGRAAGPKVSPFVLSAVSVDGSSLDTTMLSAAWQPLIGSRVDGPALGRLSDAIAKIEDRNDIAIYTVLIPDQSFADGVVHVKVVEGHVASTKLSGAADRPLVRAYMDKLTGEQPLRRSDLQRYVSLTRDVPALTTNMDLHAGNEEGAIEIAVDGKQPPVQFGLAVNNRGTATLGRTQVEADLYLNGWAGQGSQTRFTYATPTDFDRFQYGAVAHAQQLDANGTTLLVNAAYLRTKPFASGIIGNAWSGGIQLSHPLIRSYDRNLTASIGFDGLNSNNAFLGTRFSDDRPRTVRGSLSFGMSSDRMQSSIAATLSQGVDALGARTRTPDFTQLDFTKVNGRVSLNHVIGKAFAVRLNAAGQWTDSLLPPSEQMALGGDQFGRAYEASFVAGDRGYAGSAELAFVPPKLPSAVAGSEVYGFVDGGRVTYAARAGFARQNYDLESAGGGVRLLIVRRFAVGVEAARGLSDPIPGVERKRWRAVFNIRTFF